MFVYRNKTTIFLLLLLLMAGVLSALLFQSDSVAVQAGPPEPALPRTITVVGRGSVTMKPDVAHTYIGVQVVDEDIKTASQKAQETIGAVHQALIELGVKENDIQTTGYSIHQERRPEMYGMAGPSGSENAPEPPPSYFVNTTLSVTIRDVDKVGDVLAAAIEAGANNIYGINFSADDPQAVMAQARELASEDARARAEELAALHGVGVGEVISISEVIGGMGAPVSFEKQVGLGGGGGGGFAPGELDVSAQLQVVYAIASDATVPTSTSSQPVGTPPTPVTEAIVGREGGQEVVVEKIVVPGPPSMPDNASLLTIEGKDDALLRKFVEHWFATSAFPGMPDQGAPELLLGQLPDALPFDPALLQDMTLLGTLEQGEMTGTTILLEANEPAEEVLQTLTDVLQEAGLETPKMAGGRGHGGVFGPAMPVAPAVFCSDEDDSWLTVTASDVEDNLSTVRIVIREADMEFGVYSPCNLPETPEMAAPGMALLPPLQAPAGSRVVSGGGGSSRDESYQSAMMVTDLSPAQLAEYYKEELEADGWELVGEDRTKAIAWSEWQLSDEEGNPWIGSLLITRRFTRDNMLFVVIRVERAPQE